MFSSEPGSLEFGVRVNHEPHAKLLGHRFAIITGESIVEVNEVNFEALKEISVDQAAPSLFLAINDGSKIRPFSDFHGDEILLRVRKRQEDLCAEELLLDGPPVGDGSREEFFGRLTTGRPIPRWLKIQPCISLPQKNAHKLIQSSHGSSC